MGFEFRCVISHVPYDAGVTASKKAPPGTIVGVAHGTILPVDGFQIIEVDLDQPGTRTKPVKMVAFAYVRELSRNLLSIRKAVEQCGKPLVYYKTTAVLGFPGEELLAFNVFPCTELCSAVKWIPGQGTALAVAVKARDIMNVHHILANPSEKILKKRLR